MKLLPCLLVPSHGGGVVPKLAMVGQGLGLGHSGFWAGNSFLLYLLQLVLLLLVVVGVVVVVLLHL